MEVVVKNRENILQKKLTLKKELVVEGESTLGAVTHTGVVTNEDNVVNQAEVLHEGDVTFEADVTFEGELLTEKPITTINKIGTPANLVGLAVTEYGDGVNHITKLVLDEVALGSPTEAANLAFGKLLYTLPSGAQIIEAVFMRIACVGSANIVADTPDVGIGSVIATGAVAVLGGTAAFEDYITGQTSGAISGANLIEKASAATAGALTGIALNTTNMAKAIHLNCADGWAGSGDVIVSGIITIVWKTLY